MSRFTRRHRGIASLMVMLLVSSTTFTGWSKSLDFGVASEAHISDLALGKDKMMTEETDEFESDETIFAAVEISDNEKTVKVKGRLHVVEIAGQKRGPIPGLDVIVTVKGEDIANFSFSKPTKGWPLGKYKFEALLISENGETIDTEEHEFIVH